jgi:hypothetical protein
MALSFGDVAMAFGTGVMKGANESQERRQKLLDERFKALQDNKLEMAKTKHKLQYEKHLEAQAKLQALESTAPGVDRVATFMMNKGIDADKAYKFAAANPNFKIPESVYEIGEEPIFDYDVMLKETDAPVAQNYLADAFRKVVSRQKGEPASEVTAVRGGDEQMKILMEKRPQRIQETSIPAQAYPIDTGYSLEGVTPQQLPEQTEAAPITAAKVEAAPAAVDMTVPETEAVDYSSLYAADPTAEMRNRGSVANLLMEMDPTLDPKEAEQKALELDNLQVSPVTGRMVNKLNYVLGRPSGVEEIRAERAIEKQPDISMRDMGKSITAYLKTDPYNGTIENEADYMFDLTDMTRNIRSEFGLGTGEARNVAELMLLPDVGAIAKQDTYMPDLLEDNYTYDPAGSIDLPTLRMAMKKNPGKSPRQIITRIRELRMRAAQQ